MGARRRRRRRVRFDSVSRSRKRNERQDRARRDTERSFCQFPKKHTRDPKGGAFSVFISDSFRTARRSVVFSDTAVACVFVRQVRCRCSRRGVRGERDPGRPGGPTGESRRVRARGGARETSTGACPVWSAFGGARGATRRSSRTDSARSISGDPPIAAHVEERRGRVRRCASRWLRRAFRRLLCPVRPMATATCAASRKRSSPPRRARSPAPRASRTSAIPRRRSSCTRPWTR